MAINIDGSVKADILNIGGHMSIGPISNEPETKIYNIYQVTFFGYNAIVVATSEEEVKKLTNLDAFSANITLIGKYLLATNIPLILMENE